MSRLLFFSLAALLLTSCGGSRTAAPRSAQARGLGEVRASALSSLPLLVQRSARERTVAVQLVFEGGTRLLTPEQEGLEALTLETVLGGASPDASGVVIRQRLADLGARVSAEPGLDYSVIRLHCLERHLPAAWSLLMGQVMSPAFDPDEFEGIKGAYLERLLRLESNPEVVALRRARASAFYQHPYVGTTEGRSAGVAELSLDSVQAHYARLLRIGRVRVVAAGGVDPDRLQQELTATLVQLPQPAEGGPPPLPAPPAIQLTDRAQFLDASEGAESPSSPSRTAWVAGFFHAPAPATRQGLAFQLALVALQRRLEADLCQRRNLTCAIRVLHEPAHQAFATIALTTELAAPSIRALLAALKDLRTSGLLPSEVESARAELLAQTYDGLQDSDGRARMLTAAWMQGTTASPAARADWRLAATAPLVWRSVSADEVNASLQGALGEVAWTYVGDTRSIGFGIFGER